jgi:hypothetical protein
MTGIEEHSGYYPRGLRQISRVALPILAMLRSLDAPFLNSDLGTHYLVFSQKESAESSSSGAIPRKGPNLKTPARFFPPRMKCR